MALRDDGQLDPLGVEAQEAGDSLGPGNWRLVAPYDVGVGLAADLRGPVRRVALERAVRRRVRGPEEIGTHVLLRQVVAGRQAGLVPQDRPVRLCQLLAGHPDLDLQFCGPGREPLPS